MIFSEILVLFLALVIAITLVLMLRKLFFGRKSKIQIDKKVNSENYLNQLDLRILKEKFFKIMI